MFMSRNETIHGNMYLFPDIWTSTGAVHVLKARIVSKFHSNGRTGS